MKQNHYKGKYTAKRKKAPLWLWLIPLVMLFISLIATGKIIWDRYTAQAEYARMAAAVREAEAAVATAETVLPTEFPETTAGTEPTQTVETTVVTEPESTGPLPQYQALFEENPEMAGWLRIDGTKIDYPVMHTPDDPEKYLHLSFQGEYNYGGVPFIDYRCTEDSDNIVIYGHNMSDGSMFCDLPKYEQKKYWEEHPTIRYDSVYEEREYEVVAAFYDRVYYTHENVFKFYNFITASTAAEYNEAIEKFKEKSIYDTGVTPQYGDQLITLVTCTYQVENGRFVLVAREKQPDTN